MNVKQDAIERHQQHRKAEATDALCLSALRNLPFFQSETEEASKQRNQQDETELKRTTLNVYLRELPFFKCVLSFDRNRPGSKAKPEDTVTRVCGHPLDRLSAHDCTCAICYEEYFLANENESEQHYPISLPCGHQFGQNCLATWFVDGDNHTCPNCRREFSSKQIYSWFPQGVQVRQMRDPDRGIHPAADWDAQADLDLAIEDMALRELLYEAQESILRTTDRIHRQINALEDRLGFFRNSIDRLAGQAPGPVDPNWDGTLAQAAWDITLQRIAVDMDLDRLRTQVNTLGGRLHGIEPILQRIEGQERD